MKLLTFLGTGKYQSTVYQWKEEENEHEFEAEFAPAASCRFLKADEVVVFLTEEAQQMVFDRFIAALPHGVRIRPIEVPLGKSESEMWSIFDRVRSQVQPREEVAFDVTHGLRSSPILSILAAAFLKAGFDVQIKAVLYGAFEAGLRDETGKVTHAPMFDLTPLLTLLEWAVAADRFNRTGDSRYLASLLKQQQKAIANSANKDKARYEQAGKLGNLAGALTGLTQNLQLIRPQAVIESAGRLPEQINDAVPVLAQTAAAQPFQVLLNTIIQTYQPLRLSFNPEDNLEKAKEILRVERQMIRWYAERELWMQAFALAREWLISWLMVQTGFFAMEDFEARKVYENLLGAESDAFVKAKKSGKEYSSIFLGNLPSIEEVFGFWPTLADYRNDLLHAGHRPNPAEADKLIKNLNAILKKLDALPL